MDQSSQTVPINGDFYLFAEDLLSFVKLKLSSSDLLAKSRRLPFVSPLSNSMRLAAAQHIRNLETEIRNVFNCLLDRGGNLSKQFGEFTREMVSAFCLRDYQETDFLLFCSVFAMLAVLGCNTDSRLCHDHAVFAIVHVLHFLQKTGKFKKDGWQRLSQVASMEIFK